VADTAKQSHRKETHESVKAGILKRTRRLTKSAASSCRRHSCRLG